MRKTGRIGGIGRRLWGVVAAVVVVTSVSGTAPAASEKVEAVGTLPMDLPPNADATSNANTSLVFDSSIRRGYQVIRTTAGLLVRAIDLDSRRVVVEKELPPGTYGSGPAAAHTSGSSAEWVHTLDETSHVLYVAFLNGGRFGGVVAIDGRTLDVVKTLPYQPVQVPEPTADRLTCTSQSCLPQSPTINPTIVGMSFVSPDFTGLPPKLLLMYEDVRPAGGLEKNYTTMWVALWDVNTGRQDWITRVAGCANSQLPVDNTYYQVPLFWARLGSGVYVPCITSGGTGTVVRIVLDANNRPTSEQAFPGPLNTFDWFADPDADHMLFRVSTSQGESWWVFDGPSSSYSGIMGFTISPTKVGAGIDPTSGRLYVLSAPTSSDVQQNLGGLQLSDSRRAPAPQPLQFPEFAQDGTGRIVVDVHPETGRRFVYARPDSSPEYLIFEDRVPLGVDDTIADQDSLTVDVPEKEGVTGRNFTGGGRAYGARALLAGGLEGFLPTGPNVGVRVGRHTVKWVGSPCARPDRELVVGFSKETGLSDNLANAAAVSFETDPSTKTDLEETTARCYPRPLVPVRDTDLWQQISPFLSDVPADMRKSAGVEDYPRPLDRELDDDAAGNDEDDKGTPDSRTDSDELVGTRHPSQPLECTGDAKRSAGTTARPFDRGDADTSPFNRSLDETREQVPEPARSPVPSGRLRDQSVHSERLRAQVACEHSKGRTSTYAGAVALQVDDVPGVGSITVGQVDASTDVFLDPEDGLVSRSIATARDIRIGEDISIDLAFTIGEAWAHGRPGTAGTRFVRRICGVRLKDQLQKVDVYAPNVKPNLNLDPGTFDPNNPDPDSWVPAIQSFLANPGQPEVEPEGGGPVNKGVDLDTCGDPNLPATGSNTPLIDQINRVLGSRGRASAPQPDSQLRQGSPGGYLASIQKDRLEQMSAGVVNNDPSTQVPAFELVVFNDDPTEGRGRQVYQLAGVDASSTYGIYLLNPDETPADLPDIAVDLTGGVPPVEGATPAPVGPQPTGTSGPAPRGPLTILYSSIAVLFRSPGDALLAAALWALMFAPVQLAARRRALRTLA